MTSLMTDSPTVALPSCNSVRQKGRSIFCPFACRGWTNGQLRIRVQWLKHLTADQEVSGSNPPLLNEYIPHTHTHVTWSRALFFGVPSPCLPFWAPHAWGLMWWTFIQTLTEWIVNSINLICTLAQPEQRNVGGGHVCREGWVGVVCGMEVGFTHSKSEGTAPFLIRTSLDKLAPVVNTCTPPPATTTLENGEQSGVRWKTDMTREREEKRDRDTGRSKGQKWGAIKTS